MNHMKRFITVLILVLLALASSTLRPAQAQIQRIWTHTDSFESNPSASWSFSGTAGSGYFHSAYWLDDAHTGNWFVELNSDSYTPNTWYSVGKTLRISPAQQGYSSFCTAKIWIRGDFSHCPFGCASSYYGGHGNFEIIDPVTWNYIAVIPWSVSPASPYAQFATGNWGVFTVRPDVVVRIAIISDPNRQLNSVHIDDLTVSCRYAA